MSYTSIHNQLAYMLTKGIYDTQLYKNIPKFGIDDINLLT